MKTIAEMFKDLKFDEERPVYTKAMDEAMDDVIFTIENSSNDQFDKVLKRFLSKDVLKQLEDLEETQGLNPKDVTRRHIELALEIGDYYRNLNFRHFGQKTFNQQNVSFDKQEQHDNDRFYLTGVLWTPEQYIRVHLRLVIRA